MHLWPARLLSFQLLLSTFAICKPTVLYIFWLPILFISVSYCTTIVIFLLLTGSFVGYFIFPFSVFPTTVVWYLSLLALFISVFYSFPLLFCYRPIELTLIFVQRLISPCGLSLIIVFLSYSKHLIFIWLSGLSPVVFAT